MVIVKKLQLPKVSEQDSAVSQFLYFSLEAMKGTNKKKFLVRLGFCFLRKTRKRTSLKVIWIVLYSTLHFVRFT